jgi:hypothetical protein
MYIKRQKEDIIRLLFLGVVWYHSMTTPLCLSFCFLFIFFAMKPCSGLDIWGLSNGIKMYDTLGLARTGAMCHYKYSCVAGKPAHTKHGKFTAKI